MTARTHDLFAFSGALGAVVLLSDLKMSFGTAVTAFVAVFLGGLAPDLDEPGSALWRRLPAGSGTILGKVIAPVFGSHRFLSHSLIGAVLFGFLVEMVLNLSESVLIVDQTIVWWGFMIGFFSHIVSDAMTKEGVPIFSPLPIKFGIPPLKFLRIKTGGFAEMFVVFPALLAIDTLIVVTNYQKIVNFFNALK